MNFPSKVFEKAVEQISFLPGIGKRTAVRLALFMIKQPKFQTESLSKALFDLVNDLQYCSICHNISDTQICEICGDFHRNKNIICVVEDVRDVMAIENTQQYAGQYHILGGKISPLEGVGPQHLAIPSLIERVKQDHIEEIIFALSSTMEGDTTMFYLYKLLNQYSIIFSTISRGIGIGDELEYTDEITLGKSIQNRVPYKVSFVST